MAIVNPPDLTDGSYAGITGTHKAVIYDPALGRFRDVLVGELWPERNQVAYTGDASLTSGQVGRMATNFGAGGTVTLTLPAATAAGWRFAFRRIAAFPLRVAPPSGQEIMGKGVGEYIELQTNGARLDVESVQTGGSTYRWAVATMSGEAITQDAQENFTASDTLTSGESGKLCTNIGATQIIMLTLPAAAVGLRFRFRRVANYELRVDPSGSEVIGWGAAGKYLSALTNNTGFDVSCLVAGAWIVENESGVCDHE